jgi:hypothetical protein
MRGRWLLLVFVATPLALVAWPSASEGGTPTCTAADRNARILVFRAGYYLACNPGSAVATFKGTTYRMKGSRCFISSRGARLYFGAQRFDSARPLPPPLNGLYLVIEPNRNGAVDVADGHVDLASGLRAAIVGRAHATDGLRRGTFTIFGHVGNGQTDSRRFTGSWHCG